MAFGDELPESVGWAQDLVGGEPDVYEEFDSSARSRSANADLDRTKPLKAPLPQRDYSGA